MVHGEQEHVLGAAQPEQRGRGAAARGRGRTGARPPRRPGAAPPPRAPPPAAPAGRPRAAAGGPAGAIAWTGCPLRDGEGGAQALVPTRRSRRRRAARRGRVERARRSRTRGRDVVARAARLELVEEPEPLLGEGERQRAVPRSGPWDGGLAAPPAPCALDPPRPARRASAPRRGRAAGARTPRRRAQPRHHPGGQQRVAAEVEEARRPPRPGQRPAPRAQTPASSSSIGVRGRDEVFCGRRLSRAPAGPGGPPCRWASAAARRGRRRPTAPCDSGSVSRRRARSSARRDASAASRRHDIGDQALAAGRPRGAVTTASRTAGMAGEGRLDLAQLDAEAADLHLVVDAAEELERAVRPPAREVAGPVEPRAGLGRRTDRGRSAPPSAPAGRGSRGPAGAADVELAGHPDRHRLQPRRRGRRPACRRSAGRSAPSVAEVVAGADQWQQVKVVSSVGP